MSLRIISKDNLGYHSSDISIIYKAMPLLTFYLS
jgi:hypothetical protein